MEVKHSSIIDELIVAPKPEVKTIIKKEPDTKEVLNAREQRRKDKQEHRNKKKGL